jgi:Cu/Ag efflux protein CusF
MKILLTTILTALIFFAPAVSSAEKVVIKHAIGEVLAIDIAAKSLTIKKKSMDAEFYIDDATVVKAGKEKKIAADIKIGDSVVVKYFVKEGVKTTKIIEIKQPKQQAASAAKPDHK